jgi:hypothetical protein
MKIYLHSSIHLHGVVLSYRDEFTPSFTQYQTTGFSNREYDLIPKCLRKAIEISLRITDLTPEMEKYFFLNYNQFRFITTSKYKLTISLQLKVLHNSLRP